MSKIPITEFEYEMLKRQAKNGITGKRKVITEDKADPEPESILMGKIMKYCKNEGFPCQCFRPSRKAIGFLVPGWPD